MRHGWHRLTAARVLIALASLGGVLIVAYVDVERTSPGPVALVHARIAEVEGGANCNACHGGWRTSMTEACLECHQPIAEQITAGKGLHGTLPSMVGPQSGTPLVTDPNACGRCHGEHHGNSFTLVHTRSFVLAGVPDVSAFDHTRIGWPMDGRHTELDCTECHTHADVSQLPEGAQRYLGLDRSCATCHEDPHEGVLTIGCASCHVQTSFEQHVPIGHERHLPLTGAHAELSCRSCHAEDSVHSLEILAGGRARPPSRGCADCHESPHAVAFVDAIAHEEGTPRARVCSVCHTSEHLAFRAESLTMTAQQHTHTGFVLATPHVLQGSTPVDGGTPVDGSTLDGGVTLGDPTVPAAHAGLTCAGCHDPALQTFGERYPGRRSLDCAACHEDPHEGQFIDGAFNDPTLTGGGCVTCHATTAFTPHEFDLTDHDRAAFVVDGAHAALECDACHVVAGDTDNAGPRRFNGTPSRCEECHEDAHEGAFATQAAELDAVAAGDCARCHGTAAFKGVLDFEHGHFTGFALRGAHAEGSCEACHAPQAERDRLGRSFSRVSALFPELRRVSVEPGATTSPNAEVTGSGAQCRDCHANPHGTTFQRGAGSPLGSGTMDELAASDCARCHEESSFRSLPNGFDHGAETGFPLVGAHAVASCSACHAPLDAPDARGRTTAEASGVRCIDCHADPHAGQFVRVDQRFPHGGVDCGRCHDPSGAFRANTFDHTWDTEFPLEGAHASVACAACHKSERVEGSDGAAGGTTSLVRYRPVAKQCVDCHGAQAGTLRRRGNGRVR